jgi:hypothetical protein
MQQGRGGMGSHKHGTSGRAPKSPKLRLAMKIEANRSEVPAKPKDDMQPSVHDLLHPKKKQ